MTFRIVTTKGETIYTYFDLVRAAKEEDDSPEARIERATVAKTAATELFKSGNFADAANMCVAVLMRRRCLLYMGAEFC